MKQLQAGTKPIYLLVSKIIPPCCQRKWDKAEPGCCQSQGLGKVPPAGGTQVIHREGRKACGLELIKEEANNPSKPPQSWSLHSDSVFFLP